MAPASIAGAGRGVRDPPARLPARPSQFLMPLPPNELVKSQMSRELTRTKLTFPQEEVGLYREDNGKFGDSSSRRV